MKKLLCMFALLAFATCTRAEIISTSKSEVWVLPIVSGDITWSSKGSQSSVYAVDDTGEDDILQNRAQWTKTSASSTTLPSTYSKASTDGNYLYGDVYARTDATTVIFPYATAGACRLGNFVANSTGWVTFSANYKIWLQLRTEHAGELAYGIAEAGLRLYNYNTFVNDDDCQVFEKEIYDVDFFTDSESGALTVRLWFNAGDVGSFDAWADNEAKTEMRTPEPATIALLALGILSSRRRK